MVTGATSGIGLATARRLAAGGAIVVVHGRERARVDRAVAQIRAGGGEAESVVADLGSLRDTVRLAHEVAERGPALDALISNAGVGPGSPGGRREVSRDGIELRFAVNYLAHYAFTGELLRRGLPRRAIVNVSSIGQAPIDFDDPLLERRYDGWQAYCQSKLAQVMLTFDLAPASPGVGVNALHPGTFLDAEAIVSLLEKSLTEGMTGRYFDVKSPARPDPQADDPDARRRLRELSEALLARALG
jgi:NAD(P)-dependent dehydrogenase (short-subunit alcohol dehydrogenase family)